MGERDPFLRESSLFASLPDAEVGRIGDALTTTRIAAGDVLIKQGDAPDAAYLIGDGQAAVVGTDAIGDEVTLRVFGPHDTVGEVGLLTGAPRTATVKAATDLTAHVLRREAFEALRPTCPAFVARLRSYADLLDIDRFLQTASPFQGLTKERIRWIASRMRALAVKRGAVVVREGDRADLFYFIRSGTFEVLRGGKRVHILGPGDVFGEIALLTGGTRIASVRATDDAELYTLSKPDFEEAIKESAAKGRLQELTRIRYRATTGQSIALPDPVSTFMPFLPSRQRDRYWLFLLAGLLLYAVASLTAIATGNHFAAYAALVAGAFVVPIVYVVYLADTGILESRPVTLAVTFVLGALLGLPIAVVLERSFGVTAGVGTGALVIAVIEEIAKVLAIVWLLRRTTARFQMDGIVFGAAAGMGFAAFESMLFGLDRLDQIGVLLPTLFFRAALSPLGHGTWTAIVVGTIWRSKSARGIRIDAPVLLALATAIGLHALWDLQPLPGYWALAWALGVGIIGILLLRTVVQQATAEELTAVVALNPELVAASPNAERIQCRVCDQMSPPGAHYCVRCGAALVLSPEARAARAARAAKRGGLAAFLERSRQRRPVVVFTVALLIVSLLVAALLPSQALAAQASLRVLRGAVELAPSAAPDAFTNAFDGQIVSEGDRVRTRADSNGLLTFLDGSHLEIEPSSAIRMEASRIRGDAIESRVFQSLGRTWSSVNGLTNPQSKFEIGTPAAVAGVRGTGFEVVVQPSGVSRFRVYDGVVAVSAQGREVLVPRRFEVTVVPGFPPPDPTPMPNEINKLRIGGHSPIRVLLTDPFNRTCGDHPDAGVIRQIPGCLVSANQEPKLVDVEDVFLSGAYQITVIGTGDGSFSISASGFQGERLGELAFNRVKERTIRQGEILGVNLDVEIASNGRFERAELGEFRTLQSPPGKAVARGQLRPVPPFLLLQLAAGDAGSGGSAGPPPRNDQASLFDPLCGGFGPVLSGCAVVTTVTESPSPSPGSSPGATTSPSPATTTPPPATTTPPAGETTPPPGATTPPPPTTTPPPGPTTPPPGTTTPPPGGTTPPPGTTRPPPGSTTPPPSGSAPPPSGTTPPPGPTTTTPTVPPSSAPPSSSPPSSAPPSSPPPADTTPPTLASVPNVTVEATSGAGATVTYSTPSATDNSGSVTVGCSPVSGSTFALGTTTVTCTATDGSGNTASKTFTVTVRDTTPPVLNPSPPTAAVGPLGPGGATVTYPTPTATDAVDGPGVSVVCIPVSGAVFPPGTTLVTCEAVDAHFNVSTTTFTVTVGTATSPTITITPPFQIVSASSSIGTVVTWTVTATDTIDGPIPVTCTPPSGSTFPVGVTIVLCSATNSAGVTAQATFIVLVFPAFTAQSDVTIVVVEDENGDGDLSMDELFLGLEGRNVTATNGSTFLAATTDELGSVVLSLTPTGTWTVCVTSKTGWAHSVPGSGCATVTSPTTQAVYLGERETVAPNVSAIARANSSPTNATSVSWTVSFTEAVSGVDASDFTLVASGITGASITGASGSGGVYTVTANTGSGDGTLRLDLADNDTIADTAGNKLGGAGAGNGGFTGETYVVDKTALIVGMPDLITADDTGTSGIDNVTKKTSVTLTVSAKAGASVQLYTGGGAAIGAPTTAAGTNTATFAGVALAEGANTFKATATDAFVTTPFSATLTVTRDTIAPSINTPANMTVMSFVVSGTAVMYSVTASEGATPACAPASGTVFPVGTTIVTCIATDIAGNSASATFTVTVTFTAIQWSGLLEPFDEATQTLTHRSNSSVPLKFRLEGASKALDGTLTPVYRLVLNGTIIASGSYVFDPKGSPSSPIVQYSASLETRDLARGTYLLQTNLGDGIWHDATLTLK